MDKVKLVLVIIILAVSALCIYQYNSSYTNKVDVEVSNYEDFNNWIDKLIINSSTKSIVKLPNGSFKEIEVSSSYFNLAILSK